MEIEMYNNVSDEEYLVLRAKNALKNNPAEAKSWMITAKTLYPNNFGVQFEAYQIEKEAGNYKEAAKCFSELFNKFQQQQELWHEVEKVTAALRCESETIEPEIQFLCEMFKHIPLELQHRLLLVTADHCEDTMEHCRLLLLLLKKFPQSIVSHGPRLVDTLLSAEKHSHFSNQPVNCYRKLLVSELLPLLGDPSIDLSSKLLFRLLHKAIEYYLCSLLMNSGNGQETNQNTNESWMKLFQILDLTGRHLNWDPYLTAVGSWNKDSYWHKILQFFQMHKNIGGDDHTHTKQLLYCLTILFLYNLYEYTQSLVPKTAQAQIRTSLILVEAFTDSSLSPPESNLNGESKSKRRRNDSDPITPSFTIDKPGNNNLYSNFIMAANCWDLLHSTESLSREFLKLAGHLKLETILLDFKFDYAIYKGLYDDALIHLQPKTDPQQSFIRNIRLTSLYYYKNNYNACFEHMLLVIPNLPSNNIGQISQNMAVGGDKRHLHFLPVTQNNVLQYCVRLLIDIIKDGLTKMPLTYNELALGILITLVQLDWPQQENLIPPIMDQIRQRNSFHYAQFQSYVINIDILEELMYLWTEHGGRANLEIFPLSQNTMGQRRIGTRGADKGVKEDFKQAMRRQVARCNEPLDKLIIQFITSERSYILQTLLS